MKVSGVEGFLSRSERKYVGELSKKDFTFLLCDVTRPQSKYADVKAGQTILWERTMTFLSVDHYATLHMWPWELWTASDGRHSELIGWKAKRV